MMNNNNLEKSGFMYKLESGLMKKGWKKKFLRLFKDGYLLFFNNEKSTKPIDRKPVYVRGIKFWYENVHQKKSFCIKIEKQPDPIFLSATNEETIISWSKHFQSVGGIGCKIEVNLDDHIPLLPLKKWKKQVVQAWLSCTYFQNGRTLQTVLGERMKSHSGKKLQSLDFSSFERSLVDEKNDYEQKMKRLNDSEKKEIKHHLESLKRRNGFDFGEGVVLQKINNMISHIPNESKENLDFQFLARALSNPDVMIETYMNLSIEEDSIHLILMGKTKEEQQKQQQEQEEEEEEEEEEGEEEEEEEMELSYGEDMFPHEQQQKGDKKKNENAPQVLSYDEKILRGDNMVIPLILFFFEDLDFTEMDSVQDIFSPVLAEVPTGLSSRKRGFFGFVKPSLFVGPWMITWDDCGLCIPRKIANDGLLYRLALDLSLNQTGISQDLKLSKFSYREIVTRLSKVICRWNRRCVNINKDLKVGKHVLYLPNVEKRYLFKDLSKMKSGGGSLWKSSSTSGNSGGLSDSTTSFDSFDSLSEKNYKRANSYQLMSEIFATFEVDNFWELAIESTIGIDRAAGEIRMEFNPKAANPQFLVKFQGKTRETQDLGKSDIPVFFRTHEDLDNFTHILYKANEISYSMDFPLIKLLFLTYDRYFWLKHIVDPNDERFCPKKDVGEDDDDDDKAVEREDDMMIMMGEITRGTDKHPHHKYLSMTKRKNEDTLKTKSHKLKGCLLNALKFQTRVVSVYDQQRGLVDFQEVINWGIRNEVEPLISQDGNNLRFVQKNLNDDKSLVKIAVNQNARALKYASERLRSDNDVIKKSVKQDGLTIRYATEQFIENDNKNQGVLMVAVKQNGEALQYFSKNARDKKKIVKCAVQKQGSSIFHASERLKDDYDIALLAVKSDAKAYLHISERLKKEKEIVLEVVKNDYRFLMEHVKEESFRQHDEEILQVFMKGAIGSFSEMVFYDFQTELHNKDLVSRVYEATKNGDFLVEVPIYTSFSSENTIYIGFSKNDEPSGFGVEFTKISGSNRKKKKNNRFVFVTPDGNMYEKTFVGHYKNGLKSGKGMVYIDNKLIFEGVYKKNRRHGRGEYYDIKTNIVQKGVWKNDHLDENDQDGFSYPIIKYVEVAKHLKGSNRIGVGGNGSVYRLSSSLFTSYFKLEEKNVAVKIMNTTPGYHDRMTFLMTKRGIGLVCSIPDRENILEIYGIIRGSCQVGYAMKLCDQSIEDLIKKSRKKTSEKIPLEEKIRILQETSRGMRSLHSRYVMHRDLKWANIMCDFDDDRTIKITDFDTSKEDEVEWRMQSIQGTKSIGTSGFLAPEVFSGTKYTLKCDVFAFGLMIYCLLWEVSLPYVTQFQCNCGTSMKIIFSSNKLDYHVSNCNLRPLLDPREVERYPKFLIELMISCWNRNPFNRPTFEDICFRFDLDEKKNFSMIYLRFPKHKSVSDQKMFIAEPFKYSKIVEWIEKKFNEIEKIKQPSSSTEPTALAEEQKEDEKVTDEEEDEEDEETEGEEDDDLAVPKTRVVSIGHSILGTVSNDDDLIRLLEKQDNPVLNVELSYFDIESYEAMTGKRKDKMAEGSDNLKNDEIERNERELKKKVKQQEDEIAMLKRLLEEKNEKFVVGRKRE